MPGSLSMGQDGLATYAATLGANPLKPLQAGAGVSPGSTEAVKRAAIDKTSHAFEASFLSAMFGQMFEGVKTAPPFGGGEGETAFRSFLTDAMGKAVTQRGGIGLSKAISREMLKMQGLS